MERGRKGGREGGRVRGSTRKGGVRTLISVKRENMHDATR